MKTRIFTYFAFLSLLLFLAGCGGGGSTTTSAIGTGGNSGSDTIISGVASAGLFQPGSVVRLYRIRPDGSKDTSLGGLLSEVAINNDVGEFNANLGVYTGPLLVEVTGRYLDGATGALSPTTTLHAAVANASGTTTVSVTSLTELAVQLAGTLTGSAITSANALVSDIYKLDIIGTRPIGFDASTILRIGPTPTSDYALALAAFAELSRNSDLATTIGALKSDLADGTLSEPAAAGFSSALTAILNASHLPATTTENLLLVGMRTATVKIFMKGSAAPVAGVQLTLTLPAGTSVPTEKDLIAAKAGYVVGSGGATGLDMFVSVEPATLAVPTERLNIAILPSLSGIAMGEILTIRYNLAAGVNPPLTDFVISGVVAFNSDVEVPVTLYVGQ